MLTETRKADRLKMAAAVKALCDEMGATCTIRDDSTHIWSDGSRPSPEYRNRLFLDIAKGGATVGLYIDGNRSNSTPNHFCLPWNSERRMSWRFGSIARSSVNEFRRRKCPAFADGFEGLLNALRDIFDLVDSGGAFEADPIAEAV